MQVTQTQSQGLKREFKVVLPAADLAERVEGQLAEIKAKAQVPDFRPGKVPVSHLRRLYGRSIMAEVVQEAINEANRKIIEDNQLRLATEPQIGFPSEAQAFEKVFDTQADLAFTVAIEVLPKVELGSFDDIEIERLVADVSAADIDQALMRLAELPTRTWFLKKLPATRPGDLWEITPLTPLIPRLGRDHSTPAA